MDLLTLAILLLAGLGAGIITGLIGASAVLIMAPLLIIVLGMDAYLAIGLSLATDIVASIIAARVYYKNKHIKLTSVIPLLLFSFVGIVIGSYASFSLPAGDLGIVTGIGIFVLGIVFILKKEKKHSLDFLKKLGDTRKKRIIILSILGIIVGLICGIFGAGGGIAILAVLVLVLGFTLHEGIGTAIAMMVIMAFFGAVTHFYYKPFPIVFFLIAGVGAFFGAKYSSIIANRFSERKLKTIIGIILVIVGLILTAKIFLS